MLKTKIGDGFRFLPFAGSAAPSAGGLELWCHVNRARRNRLRHDNGIKLSAFYNYLIRFKSIVDISLMV